MPRRQPFARPLPQKEVVETEIAKFALILGAWTFSVGTAMDDRWLESYTVKAGQQDVGECFGRDRLQIIPGDFCTHCECTILVQSDGTIVVTTILRYATASVQAYFRPWTGTYLP